MKTKLLYGILALLFTAPFSFGQNFTITNNTDEGISRANNTSPMQVIRLELRTKKGVSREIAVQFSDYTSTELYDQGYDQRMNSYAPEDIYTYLDKDKMVVQAYSTLTYQTVVPLAIHTTGAYKYDIRAIDFDNFERDTGVYLWDKYENEYFDLRSGLHYGFSSGFGEFTDRFVIIFKTNQKSSSNAQVYFNNATDKLVVKGIENEINNLTVYNLNGIAVTKFNGISTKALTNGVQLSNLREGIYVVNFTDINGQMTSKKIAIN